MNGTPSGFTRRHPILSTIATVSTSVALSRIHLLFVLTAALAFGQTKSPRKLIGSMDGKELFIAYCASCHGVNGKGDGPVAAALRAPLADLRTISQRNKGVFPQGDLEKMIIEGKSANGAHGSEEMPVWGPLFRRVENDRDMGLVRVRRLTEFLKSIQTK